MPEAIRKMTSAPAERLRFPDRGRIAPGFVADLVLFDPATVIDHSTFAQPQALSEGVVRVIVNGRTVWENGRATGEKPGRVLAGQATAPK